MTQIWGFTTQFPPGPDEPDTNFVFHDTISLGHPSLKSHDTNLGFHDTNLWGLCLKFVARGPTEATDWGLMTQIWRFMTQIWVS